jgi:ribosome-associated heat shock protein Hsp15
VSAVDGLRLDKWLWAARMFKTRALAHEALELGRVRSDGVALKPSRAARVGETLEIRRGEERWVVKVVGLSAQRGPAAAAQALYEETPESRAERERKAQSRRYAGEPSAVLKGRPTKREGREMRRLRDEGRGD